MSELYGLPRTFNSTDVMNSAVTDNELEVLKESVGQVVNLGLGDVAMEVAFIEEEDGEYRTRIISFIFGGYSRSTYTSDNQNDSVFYLGRIVSGPTDFSFIQHFVPGNLLPVRAGLCFSTKYPEKEVQKDYHCLFPARLYEHAFRHSQYHFLDFRPDVYTENIVLLLVSRRS